MCSSFIFSKIFISRYSYEGSKRKPHDNPLGLIHHTFNKLVAWPKYFTAEKKCNKNSYRVDFVWYILHSQNGLLQGVKNQYWLQKKQKFLNVIYVKSNPSIIKQLLRFKNGLEVQRIDRCFIRFLQSFIWFLHRS